MTPDAGHSGCANICQVHAIGSGAMGCKRLEKRVFAPECDLIRVIVLNWLSSLWLVCRY